MKYVFLVFIVVFARQVNAQNLCSMSYRQIAVMDTNTVMVLGKVMDGSGRPLPGAQLYFKSTVATTQETKNQAPVLTTISDASGQFMFFHVMSGKYGLEVYKQGYCFFKEDLEAGTGAVIELTIDLQHQVHPTDE